ncbi:hypothetical protein HZA98_00405 [Candidatus Woesearchaeota archaeon]|nr:hypothetical protein [Candidatus Woesearchaeota archaeon]
MKNKFKWIKENYQLIIAFILFFVMMILLTREGGTFFYKVLDAIKNIFT